MNAENGYSGIAVPRFLYEDGDDAVPLCDAFGFWRSQIRNGTQCYDLESVLSLKGGLIVGEGDSGKTFYLNQLKTRAGSSGKVLSVRLRDYRAGEFQAFEQDVESFLERDDPDENAKVYLFVDGIDERGEFYVPLMGMVRKLIARENLSVWLATRRIAGPSGNELSVAIDGFPRYKLAPLRRSDVWILANAFGCDGDRFVEDVISMQVSNICSKPGGCITLLKLYRGRGGRFEGDEDILLRIAKDLCREHRDGRSVSVSEHNAVYSEAELLDCAEWIATCLVLRGKMAVFSGDEPDTPSDSLYHAALKTSRYEKGQIAAVLSTRMFEPFGGSRIRFSFSRLPFYLAAKWLSSYVSPVNLSKLLHTGDEGLSYELADVIGWVEHFRPGYAKDLFKTFPEIMLASCKSFAQLPHNVAYGLLEKRYGNLNDDVREVLLIPRLSSMRCPATERMIRSRLDNRLSSVTEIEFAIAVAQKCGYDILSDLVGIVTDRRKKSLLRREMSYEICRASEELSDSQIDRLKTLLPRKGDSFDEETIVANAMSVLWPKCLTAQELVDNLKDPVDDHVYGAYERFCRHELPKTYGVALTQESAPVFLKWAAMHVQENEPFDYLGDLARELFTLSWEWASDPRVCAGLVECVLATRKSEHFVDIPFVSRDPSYRSDIKGVDQKAFHEDRDGRMCLLLGLATKESCPDAIFEYLHVMHPLPLVYGDDLPAIVDLLKSYPACSARLLQCLRALAWRADVAACQAEFAWLRSEYPSVREFDMKHLEEGRKAAEKQWKEMEDERKKDDAEYARLREKRKKGLLGFLDKHKVDRRSFCGVSETLSDEAWGRAIPLLDLTKSHGWQELNESQRKFCRELAHAFVLGLEEPREKNEATGIYVASALLILGGTPEEVVMRYDDDRWIVIVRHLLHSAYHIQDEEWFVRMFDALQVQRRSAADTAFLRALADSYERGFSDPVHYWADRTSPELFDRVKSCLMNAPVKGMELSGILAEFWKSELRRPAIIEMTRRFMDIRVWRPPEDNLEPLFRFAFVAEPKCYATYLLGLINECPEWFDSWLRAALVMYDVEFANAFTEAGSNLAYAVVRFLYEKHPPEKRPQHTGVFSPSDIDEVYFFLDRLIGAIEKSGEDEMLSVFERLRADFPEYDENFCWHLRSLQTAIRGGLSGRAIVGMKDLLALCCIEAGKDDSRKLFTDSIGLKDLVLAALKEFESYMRTDRKPVRALWCEIPLRLWCQKPCDGKKSCARTRQKGRHSIVFPRNESWLSDAIKIYLQNRLPGMSVNREPEVSVAFCADDHESAGNADLMVEATTENGHKCTVFIEVKCNFNPQARTNVGTQLRDKYMSQRRDSAGIFLVGCYAAPTWIDCDPQKKRIVKTVATVQGMQGFLDAQMSALNNPQGMSVLAIDCGLEAN